MYTAPLGNTKFEFSSINENQTEVHPKTVRER